MFTQYITEAASVFYDALLTSTSCLPMQLLYFMMDLLSLLSLTSTSCLPMQLMNLCCTCCLPLSLTSTSCFPMQLLLLSFLSLIIYPCDEKGGVFMSHEHFYNDFKFEE